MSYKSPINCPVCKNTLDVTKLSCPVCATEISGKYAACKYCSLDDRLGLFLETFLKCKGSIKDVERALNISYPTVKGLLDDMLKALFPDQKINEPSTDKVSDILDKLESGKLSADEAAKLLDGINE